MAVPSTEQPTLTKTTDPRPIQVQYYAQLREEAGRSEETVRTEAPTVSVLFDELDQRYDFSLSGEDLRVAVNASFVDWDAPVETRDLVVFIPPVAGG